MISLMCVLVQTGRKVRENEIVTADRSNMRPKAILNAWVDAFNRADADALADFYAEDAINHQVANEPVAGKAAIRQMFVDEFSRTEMVCIVENLFEDGDWAMLEWKDPLGLRGCGFFHFRDGHIQLQRGYWDKLSFMKAHGLEKH